MRRVGKMSGTILFEKAVFVPPGYTSFLFAHLEEANSCPHTTELFRGFRQWMLQPLGLFTPPSQSLPLKVSSTPSGGGQRGT